MLLFRGRAFGLTTHNLVTTEPEKVLGGWSGASLSADAQGCVESLYFLREVEGVYLFSVRLSPGRDRCYLATDGGRVEVGRGETLTLPRGLFETLLRLGKVVPLADRPCEAVWRAGDPAFPLASGTAERP